MIFTGWDVLLRLAEAITLVSLATYTVLYHRGSVRSVLKEVVTKFIRLFKKK